MATVPLTVQIKTGTPPSVRLSSTGSLTAGDDYTFPNDGRTRLIVGKGAGTAAVLTFVTTKTVSGLAVADPTVTVATNQRREIGPFPIDLFGATVAISGITNEDNVTLSAIRD